MCNDTNKNDTNPQDPVTGSAHTVLAPYWSKELEKKQCDLDQIGGEKHKHAACLIWRRFSNLFETLQSLFWAVFGLVSLQDFELTGVKDFTRFWALLMFGTYSCCNMIVLLNMLIAMMSNSYQSISLKSDM